MICPIKCVAGANEFPNILNIIFNIITVMAEMKAFDLLMCGVSAGSRIGRFAIAVLNGFGFGNNKSKRNHTSGRITACETAYNSNALSHRCSSGSSLNVWCGRKANKCSCSCNYNLRDAIARPPYYGHELFTKESAHRVSIGFRTAAAAAVCCNAVNKTNNHKHLIYDSPQNP